jgi:hypothetical protein
VRHEGPGEGDISFFRQRDAYVWYYSRRPHMGQVLRTYMATLFLIFAWFPLMLFAAIRTPDGPYYINLVLIIVAAVGVPILILVGLRRLAMNRARPVAATADCGDRSEATRLPQFLRSRSGSGTGDRGDKGICNCRTAQTGAIRDVS